MIPLSRFVSPQLKLLHRGKVRDSFRASPDTRLMVATDRLSAFDQVLDTAIPAKGAVLSGLSAWWFERTRDIVPNHFIRLVDPAVSLIRECRPLAVEVVVRAHLAGSMWRAYQAGRRSFCGVSVPDGLTRHQAFPEPIVTPTTKSDHDEEASPAELVAAGLVTPEQWKALEQAARKLFAAGAATLAERGLKLCDTKYEFGIFDEEIVLIDEIHTPDSSRIWPADAFARDPQRVESLDKEYVRAWLLEAGQGGRRPRALPPEVAAETTRRYLELFERVTGVSLALSDEDPRERMVRHLAAQGFMKDAWVAVVMGSPGDLAHARRIRDALAPYGVAVDMRVLSAHKNGEALPALAELYGGSADRGVVVAVAGLSNGLGGALAANLPVPVLSCPPFTDLADLQVNLASSMMLPSEVPAGTILSPSNAAHLALRCLQLPRLKDRLALEIGAVKDRLAARDQEVRAAERLP
ncbi:MAG: AIR carboxylase family protein [Deltaproteobacteria bacterium]|nr:AIR carboxylase family protein [Deltaproteobacteria bacterium]